MRELTGMRFARSFLTPAGTEVLSAELDFQMGPSMGIAIHAIQGYATDIDGGDPATIGTMSGLQTLHLETGPLEDAPINPADDEQNIDTEIFYAHSVGTREMDTTVGLASQSQGNGLREFREPVIAVRNITHRAETVGTNAAVGFGVLISYKYVELTPNEFVLQLAKRS